MRPYEPQLPRLRMQELAKVKVVGSKVKTYRAPRCGERASLALLTPCSLPCRILASQIGSGTQRSCRRRCRAAAEGQGPPRPAQTPPQKDTRPPWPQAPRVPTCPRTYVDMASVCLSHPVSSTCLSCSGTCVREVRLTSWRSKLSTLPQDL